MLMLYNNAVRIIKKLNSLRVFLLSDNGTYMLKIPDKRYCFDHYLTQSELPEIISAYEEKRKVHTLESRIKMAFATHNNPVKHWLGIHKDKTRQDKTRRNSIHGGNV